MAANSPGAFFSRRHSGSLFVFVPVLPSAQRQSTTTGWCIARLLWINKFALCSSSIHVFFLYQCWYNGCEGKIKRRPGQCIVWIRWKVSQRVWKALKNLIYTTNRSFRVRTRFYSPWRLCDKNAIRHFRIDQIVDGSSGCTFTRTLILL